MTERWRHVLDAVRSDARRAHALIDDLHVEAVARAELVDVEESLLGAARRAERATASLAELARRARRLRAEREAERRHDPVETRRLLARLAADAAEDPEGVAGRWLEALFDALDWNLRDTADRLTHGARDMPLPGRLSEAVDAVRIGVADWALGDDAAGIATMEAIGDRRIREFERVLTPSLTSRALRLAAWIALRRLGDRERAAWQIDAAVIAERTMLAERAAYLLFVGDLDRAAQDAELAVEFAADDPAGYLQLGTWAELTGQFAGADDLYRRGLELMLTPDLARLHTRRSLADPSGRLLLTAADRLVASGSPDAALELADQALVAGVRGAEAHPEARAHRVRIRALEALPDRPAREAAEAALDAGRLYLWNGDNAAAVAELERAIELHKPGDAPLYEAGWLRAEAAVGTSVRAGEELPDQSAVARARDLWESWSERVGQPRRESSWAYLTRAIVEDLAAQDPGADRTTGVWNALTYVECALIQDEVDAARWGYAAHYLRLAGLEQLAFEAMERGSELSAGDRQVLLARLWLLPSRGDFAGGEEVAAELVRIYGEDASANAGRAWLAFQQDRFRDVIALLDRPLATANAIAWCLDLRALSHIGMGDVQAARADYQALLDEAEPIDGAAKCRLAVAELVVGNQERAHRWLCGASGDRAARCDWHATAALAALVTHDRESAEAELSRATRAAASATQMNDVLRSALMRTAALGDGELRDAGERVVTAVREHAGAVRVRELATNPPSADSELDEAMRRLDREAAGAALSPEETAVIAVCSRRHVQAGQLNAAAAGYERLRGSRLGEEAAIALGRVLRAVSAAHAALGDAAAVERTGARLVDIGAATPVTALLAVADALRNAGRLAEARDRVAAEVTRARDDGERIALERRLGVLCAELGDLDGADRHFRGALARAGAVGDVRAIGQIELRLSLVERLGGDAGARHRLDAAIAAFGEAGALDPAATLAEELRRLREGSSPEGDWNAFAAVAVDWAATVLAESGA